MKVLSIVVPTFNMEALLERCLSSLVANRNIVDSLEIIVVNDGSTDKSLEIANTFKGRFPETFIVVDKENGNYGSCVNTGINIATGKYFRILDADDWFSNAGLSELIGYISTADSDLIVTPFVIHEKKSTETIALKNSIIPRRVYSIEDLQDFDILLHMHSMTYRTKILQDNSIRLSEKVSYSDMEYCFFPMQYVENVAFVDTVLYHYCLSREGQTMSLAAMKRSINSMSIIANRMLSHYLGQKASLPPAIMPIWIHLVKRSAFLLYETSLTLCEQSEKISEQLHEYDRIVQTVPEINYDISNLSRHHIHYVKLWRNKGHFYSCFPYTVHDKIWSVIDPIWHFFKKKCYNCKNGKN